MHRWTAEGLRMLRPADEHARDCERAGAYRCHRVEHETHSAEDAHEAARNYFAGGHIDKGGKVAGALLQFMEGRGKTLEVLVLAGEFLGTVPETSPFFSGLLDFEAQAYLSLGSTDLAKQRYERLLGEHEERAKREPARTDYQRDLWVSYNNMGDLYVSLGDGGAARE
ncbi:MAG: hypothetical protein ACKOJF_19445, partial [Planctomycetaceae bacterium]